ncbi:hypothetical protein BGZ70_002018, partial [Mortierella alpina]
MAPPISCAYFQCTLGLIERRAAVNEQKAQVRQGKPIQGRRRKLLPEQRSHLLNYHSTKRLVIKMKRGITVHMWRRPDKNMAFLCICGNEYRSRGSIKVHYQKYCTHRPIPPGTPGITLVSTPNKRTQDDRNDHQEAQEQEDEDEDVDVDVEDKNEEEEEEDENEESEEEEVEEGENEEDEEYVDEASHPYNNSNSNDSNNDNSKSK